MRAFNPAVFSPRPGSIDRRQRRTLAGGERGRRNRRSVGARARWAAALAVFALSAYAPSAHAALNSWSSLTGLSANDGAGWVLDYGSGSLPTTLYAGTDGDGVLKSIDDGLTWSAFSNGLPPNNAVNAFYTANGQVFAATDDGLFSAPDDASFGDTWNPVAQGPETDPGHPTKLNQSIQTVTSLTGGPMLAGTLSEGVFSSTDNGQTWSPPAADNGMPLATTVWSFASFANFVWAATNNGIYRSSDRGGTWTLSSDGIPPNATTLRIFQDSQNPLIYYAGTASDGIYRSIDGGTTWQSVDGDPNGESLGNGSLPIVRAIVQLSGTTQTRLYTATSDGLWVGTLPNVTVPGPLGHLEVPGTITWRQVTTDGLGYNTIMWALTNFTSVPGTLLAGTQSNGGYSLTFQPPLNDGQPQDLPSWFGPLNVGVGLVGLPGSWSGTPQIDYSYQWQRCSSSQTNTCSDISGATTRDYTLTTADKGEYIRLVVTASNDFPTFSHDTAASAVQGPVAPQIGPLPGENQSSAPAIEVSPASDQFLPTEGDSLSAPARSVAFPEGWLLDPAASTITYQWLRCDPNGDNCVPIPGAQYSTYVLSAADDGMTIRVQVTGENDNGSTTLPLSGATNQIIPLPAQQLAAPTLMGDAYVGDTLVGGVGSWESPATWWSRQWEQCQPDGSECTPIPGQIGPEYTVQPDDVGMTIRLHVLAYVNPENVLPGPVDAYTPLSAVVSYPPGTPPPGPSGQPSPRPSGSPPNAATPGPTPLPAPAPRLSAVTLGHHGLQTELTFNLSGNGSVAVVLDLERAGHRSRSRCVAGRLRHHPGCTSYVTVFATTRAGLSAGHVTIPIPTRIHGRRLPRGSYLLTVTPESPAGQPGSSVSLGLQLVAA